MENERRKVLKHFIEQEGYMNERVADGIEHARKGLFGITVTDAEGRPVPGAKIIIHQTDHEFRMGANCFALSEMKTDEQLAEYKKLFSECFNLATLPFYWRSVEPERGKTRYTADSPYIYRRPPVDQCLEFCRECGLEPKAHCLDYDTWAPEWVQRMTDPVEIRRALYHRFEELSGLYADRIPSWEVTNETLIYTDTATPNFFLNDNIEWDFRTAERFFPLNRLIINEAAHNIWPVFKGNRSEYYMLIERSLRNGCRIDSIGMQYHTIASLSGIHEGSEAENAETMYSPEHIYKVLDCYAGLGLPMQITELSIPSYGYSEEDEDVQAEIMKDLYSIWFSHPNMEAIICWDLIDGYDWSEFKCGLLKKDLTPKKAYYTIRDLFNKTWRTDTELTTDEGGRASFRGFYGNYDVTVHAEGKETAVAADLVKNGRRGLKVVL